MDFAINDLIERRCCVAAEEELKKAELQTLMKQEDAQLTKLQKQIESDIYVLQLQDAAITANIQRLSDAKNNAACK